MEILFVILFMPTIVANLLILQELVYLIREQKLTRICLWLLVLCPLAGIAFGLISPYCPAHVVAIFFFSIIPLVRILLARSIPLGYLLILVPAALWGAGFVYINGRSLY